MTAWLIRIARILALTAATGVIGLCFISLLPASATAATTSVRTTSAEG
jgi:hypothetical protein